MMKKELHIAHRRVEGGGWYAKSRHLLGRLFAQSRRETTEGGLGVKNPIFEETSFMDVP